MSTGRLFPLNSPGRVSTLPILLAALLVSSMPLRSQNLVTNPGFESGTEGWSTTGVLTTNAGIRFSGLASGYASLGSFGNVTHSLWGVMPPGQTYSFAGRFRTDTGTRSLTISLVRVDGASAQSTSFTGTVSTTFVLLTGTFSLVATGALSDLFLRITVPFPSASINFYLDDIVITNASPALAIARATSGVSVSWPTSAVPYRLEATTNLPALNWLWITNNIRTNAGSLVYTTAPNARAFFRLMKP